MGLQSTQNRGGVAVKIGPDLEDGSARITAGQLHQIGLWHHHRNDDGLPSQSLQSERGAGQLAER